MAEVALAGRRLAVVAGLELGAGQQYVAGADVAVGALHTASGGQGEVCVEEESVALLRASAVGGGERHVACGDVAVSAPRSVKGRENGLGK